MTFRELATQINQLSSADQDKPALVYQTPPTMNVLATHILIEFGDKPIIVTEQMEAH